MHDITIGNDKTASGPVKVGQFYLNLNALGREKVYHVVRIGHSVAHVRFSLVSLANGLAWSGEQLDIDEIFGHAGRESFTLLKPGEIITITIGE